MDKSSNKAYSEVCEILDILEDEAISKVPKKIIDFFNEEKDKDYKPKIDLSKPLEEQGLMRDTIVLLAILNLNYWCDSEKEKNDFLDELRRNGEYEKEALKEKYNPDNIFKKKDEQNNGNNEKNENLQLIEYKDKNFIQRFLNKIRKLFKRN